MFHILPKYNKITVEILDLSNININDTTETPFTSILQSKTVLKNVKWLVLSSVRWNNSSVIPLLYNAWRFADNSTDNDKGTFIKPLNLRNLTIDLSNTIILNDESVSTLIKGLTTISPSNLILNNLQTPSKSYCFINAINQILKLFCIDNTEFTLNSLSIKGNLDCENNQLLTDFFDFISCTSLRNIVFPEMYVFKFYTLFLKYKRWVLLELLYYCIIVLLCYILLEI